MKNLLSFDLFESHRHISPIEVTSEEEFLEHLKKLNFLKSKWKFNEYNSMQADSKFPAIFCENIKNYQFSISLMHDDYDNTNWGIALLHEDGDIVLIITNLEMLQAYKLFVKIVGKENALVRLSKTPYRGGKVVKSDYGTMQDWLNENPLYSSEKLKKSRKIGLLDENVEIKVIK